MGRPHIKKRATLKLLNRQKHSYSPILVSGRVCANSVEQRQYLKPHLTRTLSNTYGCSQMYAIKVWPLMLESGFFGSTASFCEAFEE